MGDDEPIEIELVEHAPPRRRGRSDRPPGSPHAARPTPVDDGAQPDVPARRDPTPRLLALAAGVGVIGLAVGWLVGRAGDAGHPSSAGPATSPPSSASVGTFADDPALVEPAPPRITTPTDTRPNRPRLTTTTVSTPAVTVISPIPGVDPALVGLPYEIVTEDGIGNLQFIDLASNTLTTVDGARGGDMGRLFAGDGWVLIPNGSIDRSVAYRDGDPTPYWVTDFTPWNTLHAPGSATMWQADDDLVLQGNGTMIELDGAGDATGVTVPLPRLPMHVDADGTFIVEMPGGTFAIGPSGTTRITTGDVVAIGPTAAVVNECDESMACAYWIVDRVSGERRMLTGLPDGVRLDPLGWWPSAPAVSPDGTLALISVPTIGEFAGDRYLRYQPAILDLVNATSTSLDVDAPPWMAGGQWTADSNHAVFLAGGDLLAYSRSSGSVVTVATDVGATRPPQQFAMRPADGTPWSER